MVTALQEQVKMENAYHKPDERTLQALQDIATKLRIHSIESTNAAGSGYVFNENIGIVEPRLNDPESTYLNINEVFGITNGSILRASKSQIYIESPSIIIKRNLVTVNVFCQSLGPSLYRASTVEHSPNQIQHRKRAPYSHWPRGVAMAREHHFWQVFRSKIYSFGAVIVFHVNMDSKIVLNVI